jgi:UDP-N-acetylglucosamine 2-epimerase (non-hydrolysing)
MQRIAFVLGTRPEIIKTAPIIHEARRQGLEFGIIHSGQHYDRAMDGRFFEELGLPKPDIQLTSGGKPYAEQLAYLLREFPRAFAELKPSAIVVQGDTVTVMTAALAAQKTRIPVIHHEAGLRSRDQRMAEEYHRVITDHVSALLCAPTSEAVKNLLDEGADPSKVIMTGNTVVDAVRMFAPLAAGRHEILARHGLKAKNYFVLTFHRAENVDEPSRFATFIESLRSVVMDHPDRPIVFPIHPRVEKRRQEFGHEWPGGIVPVSSLGYLDMLRLVADADLVMTDSGGLQEECAVIGTPCVTLRDSTERPETVAAGINIVAGLETASVLAAVATMRGKCFSPIGVFGDGFAARRIIEAAAVLTGAAVMRQAEPTV